MIYEAYWYGINSIINANVKSISHVLSNSGITTNTIEKSVYLNALYEAIRDSNNSFVFIITLEQGESFNKWITEEKLTNYIAFKGPWIRNTNMMDMPRRLQIVVLQSPDHPQRKQT
jgi:hypothetical protein